MRRDLQRHPRRIGRRCAPGAVRPSGLIHRGRLLVSTFPDIEMGVLELLEPLGECYLRMTVGSEALLDDVAIRALIPIADLGGVGGVQVFRTARVRIAAY